MPHRLDVDHADDAIGVEAGDLRGLFDGFQLEHERSVLIG